jgi:hypothetical protein
VESVWETRHRPYAVGKGEGKQAHRKRRVKGGEHVLCDFYRRGLKEEPHRDEPCRLREEGEARSRRREAKVARADWRADSIVKKVRETIEAR